MSYKQQQSLPLLQFILSQNKYPEIVKSILNRDLSIKILKEYSCSKFKSEQEVHQNHQLFKKIGLLSINDLMMMKGSEQSKPKNYQNTLLKQLIRKKLKQETPSKKTRLKMWLQFTQYYQKENLYEYLKQLDLPSDFDAIIAKDINRTSTTNQVKADATEVLSQFAKYNPFIGYCQGMNFIAAFLLQQKIGMNKQQAFFILKKLTESILPTDYYTSMETPVNDVRIVYDILGNINPKIHAKLKFIMNDIGGSYMVVMSFVFQWIICLFTNVGICRQVTQIIWDFLIVQGCSALFKAAIVMFQMIEQNILHANCFCTIGIIIEQYIKNVQKSIPFVTNASEFKERMLKLYINYQILNLLRMNLRRALKSQKSGENKTRNEGYRYMKKCRRSWNACMQTIQDQIKSSNRSQIFVFKKNTKIEPIANYLDSIDNRYFQKKNQFKNKTDALLIGRMEHTCQQQQDDSLTNDSCCQQKGQRLINQMSPSQQSQHGYTLSPQQQLRKPKMVRTDAIKKRNRVAQKIKQIYKEEQKTMQRSESIMFMKRMVENESFTNLMEFYDEEGVFDQEVQNYRVIQEFRNQNYFTKKFMQQETPQKESGKK